MNEKELSMFLTPSSIRIFIEKNLGNIERSRKLKESSIKIRTSIKNRSDSDSESSED